METAELVALLGFAGVLVSTIVGAVVTIVTNRSEKRKAAEATIEKVLREKLEFKDEQIASLMNRLADMTTDRDYYRTKAEDNDS